MGRGRPRKANSNGNMIKHFNYNYKALKRFLAISDDIRARDNFRCRRCNMTELEHYEKYRGTLDVHHKNGMTDDNRKHNLITLCQSCHRLIDSVRLHRQRQRNRAESSLIPWFSINLDWAKTVPPEESE